MNKLYKVTALITLVATYVTILLTFLTAYLHPSKSVLVTINTMGEANIEFALLALTIPAICAGFKHLLFKWAVS